MQQACICINSEGRTKRKTASHVDEASDPSNTPTRQKVSVQNMMRVLRGRVVPPLPQGASTPATSSLPHATVASVPPVPTSDNNAPSTPTLENPSESMAPAQQLPNPSEADSSEGSEDPKEPDLS
ncbi:hypothetical protein GCK32_018736 [Trichostrongylus colubriformis]